MKKKRSYQKVKKCHLSSTFPGKLPMVLGCSSFMKTMPMRFQMSIFFNKHYKKSQKRRSSNASKGGKHGEGVRTDELCMKKETRPLQRVANTVKG